MGKIGIIDYGSGNFMSVQNALDYLGYSPIHIKSAKDMVNCSHIILPGVGAYASAMRKLMALNLVEAITEQVMAKKKPFLGICVGMQLLATVGKEFEEYPGLGFIEGSVEKLDVNAMGLPLPHMGWNDVQVVKKDSLLFKGMKERPCFYFVHSYYFNPRSSSNIAAYCQYGDSFSAVIEQDNLFGVQFHPEKSQHDGLHVLRNFCNIGS